MNPMKMDTAILPIQTTNHTVKPSDRQKSNFHEWTLLTKNNDGFTSKPFRKQLCGVGQNKQSTPSAALLKHHSECGMK